MSVDEHHSERLGRPLRVRGELAAVALLLVLMGFHVGAGVWWLVVDNHPVLADEALQTIIAEAYHQTLTDPGPATLLERIIALSNVYSAYPPFPHLVSAWIAAYFGFDADTAAYGTLLMFAVFIGGTYCFARTFLGPWEALFVAFVGSFTPILYASSRQFSGDPWVAALAPWALLALWKSDYFRSTPWAVAFGLINGLVIMSRPFYGPVFYLAPAAAVFAIGLAKSVSLKKVSVDGRMAGTVLLNGAITVLVSVAVFGPWYFHLLEALNEFWGLSTRNPAAAGVRSVQPEFNPGGLWFPITIINGLTGLPMFVVASLGLVAAVASRRMRRGPVFLVVLGVFGTYGLMTFLFAAAFSRYVIAVAAFAAVLAAGAVLAVPWPRARRACMAVFAAVLLFQYVNLTFASYGRFGEVQIPVLADHLTVKEGNKQGLVVYTDKLVSGATAWYAPLRGENWLDRAFGALAAHDARTQYVTNWRALYQAVAVGPMELQLAEKKRRPVGPDGRPSGDMEFPFAPVEVLAANVDLAGPGAIELALTREAAIDALAFQFPDQARAAREYTVAFEGADAPGIHFRGGRQDFHFHRFETVTARRLRVEFLRGGERNRVQLVSVTAYRLAPQPRAAAYKGRAERAEQLEDLRVTDYVLVRESADIPGTRAAAARVLGAEFEVIAEFGAPAYGNFPESEFALWARKQAPLINFASSPGFAVSVTSDLFGRGRWDVPWWPYPRYSLEVQEGSERWIGRAPAIVDVQLGRAHDLVGVQIIPFHPDAGVKEARVQAWDGAEGAWRELPRDAVDLAPPLYGGIEPYPLRRAPRPWEAAVRTERLRFVLMRGETNPAGNEDYVHVANFFLFGRPAEEGYGKRTLQDVVETLFGIETQDSTANAIEADGTTLVTGPYDAEKPPVIAFRARGKGNGSVALTLGGEPVVILGNAAPWDDLWTQGEAHLGYRAGALTPEGQEGEYRLRLPAALLTPGAAARIEARVFADNPDSSFRFAQ